MNLLFTMQASSTITFTNTMLTEKIASLYFSINFGKQFFFYSSNVRKWNDNELDWIFIELD